jgi:hypothetical protein
VYACIGVPLLVEVEPGDVWDLIKDDVIRVRKSQVAKY